MVVNEGQGQRAIEFLIAEYNEISQETRRLRQEGIVRLNFFITITSSILAVLVFLSQSKIIIDTFFQATAIGVLCLLLLVGFDTFNFTISRDVNTDLNIRATARIRRFFSEQHPEIQRYLTWRCHDESTAWITDNNSGVRRIVQYILSAICALIIGLILNLMGMSLVMTTMFGVMVLVIAFIGFRGYAVRRFKKASIAARKSVRFPEEGQRIAEGN
jgi:hypothetical protein